MGDEYRMSGRLEWERSSWYRPGNWALPRWWTNGPPVRDGRATYAEQEVFYSGWFVREVLNHKGGMSVPPATTRIRHD